MHGFPTTISPAAACAVESHAYVEATLADIAELRDSPAASGGRGLPARFLRHADEHTVVALHAVLRAIATHPSTPDFSRHAVVAASCQAGRFATARSLVQFRAAGSVAVSPHVVPQCSLHSVAGAVSVGLGIHGPHVGVGGGPDALAEGLFTALTLVGRGTGCPGAWLVVSEWDREPELDAAGEPVGSGSCRALAMLLAPAAEGEPAGAVLCLRIPAHDAPAAEPTVGTLADFASALEMCSGRTALASWSVGCPWGAEVRIVGPGPVARVRGRRSAIAGRWREAA